MACNILNITVTQLRQQRNPEIKFLKKRSRARARARVCVCSKNVSELMIVKKKQLQETVHSTLLLGCFYLLYML